MNPTTGAITETGTCAICRTTYHHFGNNPEPVLPDYRARVCDDCNWMHVIPARLSGYTSPLDKGVAK